MSFREPQCQSAPAFRLTFQRREESLALSFIEFIVDKQIELQVVIQWQFINPVSHRSTLKQALPRLARF